VSQASELLKLFLVDWLSQALSYDTCTHVGYQYTGMSFVAVGSNKS